MGAAGEEFAHLFVERGGFGDEVGFHRHLEDVEEREGLRDAVLGVMGQAVDFAQEVLGVDDAEDVFVAVAEDGQAGMGGGQRLRDDLFRRVVGVEHLDLAAVAHDFVHRAVGEVERAEQAVAGLFFHRAFGMAERDGSGDLFADGGDATVFVAAHAEGVEEAAHEEADEGDDGGEDDDQDADDGSDAGGDGFRIGDGECLWQHFAEDQDEDGHDEGGQRDAAVAEETGEERGGQRGREDVDDIVAKEERADHAFAVFRHRHGRGGPARALVGLRLELAAGRGGKGGFRAGEEGGKAEQAEDGGGGDPEGGVERHGCSGASPP